MPAAPTVPAAGTSAVVLLTLILIFGASWTIFWLQVRRWTSRREWVALSEWGRQEGFSQEPMAELPEPFDGLSLRALLHLHNNRTNLLQFDDPARRAEGLEPRLAHNVLIRRLPAPWPPAGLRPAGQGESVLDLFSLSSFPLMGSSERFVVFATDSATAAALPASVLRALLPPDVGLLLFGRSMVLDFSAREFDTIAFNRMIALADQLEARVPGLASP